MRDLGTWEAMFIGLLLAFVIGVQVVLGISPKADRMTWALENAPVWIGLVILSGTWKRFQLSRLCLVLLAIHSVILAVGGYWTYARVPAGDWAKEALHLSRNHYDRLGHFAQGFVRSWSGSCWCGGPGWREIDG
jgi:putative membrane protein